MRPKVEIAIGSASNMEPNKEDRPISSDSSIVNPETSVDTETITEVKPDTDTNTEVKPDTDTNTEVKPEDKENDAKVDASKNNPVKDGENESELVHHLGDGLPCLISDDPEEIGDENEKEPEGPTLLDLAFAMDCTGSMGSYIHQAQSNIRRIVEDIVSKEQADIKLALVEYRDHPPQDSSFITNVHDFTSSVRDMKSWLDACSASGGGDGPEAVADGLQQVLKLSWRQEATKMCVFISDAPPHGLGLDSGDGFPNGCPLGLDPMDIVNKMAEKSITMYVVGCEPSINKYKEFFTALAHITGGQYVPLRKAKLLSDVIVGGAQEEISLQKLMEEVNEEVQQELEGCDDGGMDYDELASKVHSKLQSRGHIVQQMHMNSSVLPKASAVAQNLSYCTNMEDVRSKIPGGSSHSDYAERSHSKKKSKISSKGRGGSASARGASSSGGILGGIAKWFGKSENVEDDSEDDCDDESAPPVAATSSARPKNSEDVYEVLNDDIAEEQVYRMVSKSLAANNLRSKTVSKKS